MKEEKKRKKKVAVVIYQVLYTLLYPTGVAYKRYILKRINHPGLILFDRRKYSFQIDGDIAKLQRHDIDLNIAKISKGKWRRITLFSPSLCI